MNRTTTTLAAATAIALGLASPSPGQDAPRRTYTQKPELVATGDARGPAPAEDPARTAARLTLQQGPPARWIWGPDADRPYVLSKTFRGGSEEAWLVATGDNRMTLSINGRKVASSDQWQEPVELDVQQYLLPGDNEIRAEVANAGGISGFALHLVLFGDRGRARHVVSDASWQAADPAAPAVTAAPVSLRGRMGDAPWGDVFARTPDPDREARGRFTSLPGFRVEKLFTVPRDELGSWVAITFDPKGRLLASDQADRGLCRITPPPIGSDDPTRVEHLDLPLTAAQGLLCAFDSLYLSINGGPGSGLYRARDTDGDDRYDQVDKLKDLAGGGEHGPHALRLSPDGRSIVLVAGNHTDPVQPLDASRLPTNWAEDLLLPRQWDANGHAVGRMAPGGWIARTDPDGKSWELLSAGYRNTYDIAYNAEGDLFAYDADMEWDFGMPWYRPTRALHATSGSEFGWRSGTGKWPTYYVDSLPEVVDIGPGSPVGVAFGHGSKFPAKYQKALYLCDWTFGTIYALHLEPEGSTYRAEKEEFLARTPLPLTDIAVGPDGALYFTIGGRGTQSELFRVTYTGDEPTAPADLAEPRHADLRALRRRIETYHRRVEDPADAVAAAYPVLNHTDRFLRYAARIALEHQPAPTWQDRVLAETDPETLITGAVALARQGVKDLQPRLLDALDRLDYARLTHDQKLELLRVWQLICLRMGRPDASYSDRLRSRLEALYPSGDDPEDRELCILLVYLRSPVVVARTLPLLERERPAAAAALSELLARNPGYGGPVARMLANRPDAQAIALAFSLRNVRDGWTLDQRKAYFGFLDRARRWSGGASYQGFLRNIDRDAFEAASPAERAAIESSGARKPPVAVELPKPEGPGRAWTLDEVLALASAPLRDRDFDRGRRAFGAARCVVCHRFAGEGGATGPDLTQAAGRFGVKDLTEAILDPGKVVSDQYRATFVATRSGQVYTGRVANDTPSSLTLFTDPEDASRNVEIRKDEIEEIAPSPSTLMPEKLIDTLNPDEVLDLLAYILSRGDPRDAMFRKH